MNGQHSADQAGQGAQDSHLSFLLNAASGQNALLGYPGAGGGVMGGNPGLRFGADASLEEQILQRASALRAEALMQQQQQQQQQQQRHHQQLSAALAAFQQQQLSSLGLNHNLAALMEARGAQEHEALLGRSEALRELGIGSGAGGGGGGLQVGANGGIERLQQLELSRLEELERRRQQLQALTHNITGAARPAEMQQHSEKMVQDSVKSEPQVDKESHRDAAANAEKSKDDLRKTPGTVIVPCRARGMPMDHNFKTAYFVISEDAKHGEDLVCSYFACRNGGVKFRYCAHCMAPVAKRNFCRRHDHGMSAKSGDGENQDEEDETSMDQSESTAHKDEPDMATSGQKSAKAPIVEQPSASEQPKQPERKLEPEKDLTRSSLDVLSKAATSSFLMQSGQGKRKKPSDDVDENADDVQAEVPEQPIDTPDLSSISQKRRIMWSALLIKRPRTKDPRHLSSWLNEVLTVSDFEAPLEFPDSPAPTSSETPGGKMSMNSERSKSSRDGSERSSKMSNNGSSSKEKKNGEKEKKKRKTEQKFSEDGLPSAHIKSKKEEKPLKKNGEKKYSSGIEKKSFKKSTSKDSPSKKESDDGFVVGSFADWRDRKKEKALSKKSGGSLRK